MKLKVKPKKTKQSSDEATLDPKLQTFAKLAREFAAMLDEAREKTNAANRQKTIVGREYKALIPALNIKEDECIQVDGVQFSYGGAAPRQFIDPNDLFTLYEKGKINKNQLLACLSVDMGAARKFLGTTMVTRISKYEVSGSAPSIRIKKDQVDPRGGVFVVRSFAAEKEKLQTAEAEPANMRPRIKLRRKA